ncbi:MAG: AzlD domain-containing protein [Hyphomicrobiaceae bacterium]
MTSPAGSGLPAFLLLLAGGFLATQPWRWLGIRLARDLHVDSEIFHWARAASTAIVAALVARLMVFPAGALADLPLVVRLVAFAAGIAVYLAGGRVLLRGVGVALVVLGLGAVLFGGPN